MKKDVKTLECKLGPGVFSGQRTFDLKPYDNHTYTGFASRIYCWTRDGKHQPEIQSGQSIDGLIAARILKKENGHARVEIPNGEVIDVMAAELKELPGGDWDDVPL